MESPVNRPGPLDRIEHPAYSDRLGEYAPILARASLAVFLLFLFFGTTLPSNKTIETINDVATEDPVKQVVLPSLYLLSFIGLLPKKIQAIDLMKKEKYLGLFLLWSLFTVAWADYPFLSFKRWIQTAGAVMIFVSAILHIESEDQAWGYARAVLIAYLPLSLLAIFLIPGTVESDSTAWRGFTSQKNTLGQVSLLSLIIWTGAVIRNGGGKKAFGLLFFGVSAILLVGSQSITALLTCGILLMLASVLYAGKNILCPIAGKIITSILVFSFFASLTVIFFLEPNAISSLFGLFGKDTSFTGRTNIWSLMIEEIKNHWVFGCGFQGYWSTPRLSLDMLLYDLQWGINTAHQGYLDILNETGIIGFFIFLMMMSLYFSNLRRRGKSQYWSWVVIGVLILNFMESTLFRADDVCGCLFLFSYLSLYAYPALEESGVD